MHKRRRPLLIAAVVASLMAGAGVAWAQSIGLGMGVDDLYPGKGTGVAPVPNVLLIAPGSALLISPGNRFLIQ